MENEVVKCKTYEALEGLAVDVDGALELGEVPQRLLERAVALDRRLGRRRSRSRLEHAARRGRVSACSARVFIFQTRKKREEEEEKKNKQHKKRRLCAVLHNDREISKQKQNM